MDESSTPMSAGLNSVKMWKNLTSDEKIERMRTELKYSLNRINKLNRECSDLRMILANHSHTGLYTKATVDIPMYSNDSVSDYTIDNSPNIYF